MNTLKNRKSGDIVYSRFIKLLVKVNLGDKIICEYENGRSVLVEYKQLRLPLHKTINNWYKYISGFRNRLEQQLINKELGYLILLIYLVEWSLALGCLIILIGG